MKTRLFLPLKRLEIDTRLSTCVWLTRSKASIRDKKRVGEGKEPDDFFVHRTVPPVITL